MIKNQLKSKPLSLLEAIGSGEIIFKSKTADKSELYISIIIILAFALLYFIVSKIYDRKKEMANHKGIPGSLISFSSFSIKTGYPLKLHSQGIGYFTSSVINNDKQGIIVELPHWHTKKKMIKSGDEITCFYVEEGKRYEIKTITSLFMSSFSA